MTTILGDFDFKVFAKSEGFTIRIEFLVPLEIDSPEWSRRLRILRKRGEWPQSWDDVDAFVVEDDSFFTAGEYSIEESDLIAGEIYYYALYTLRNDGEWSHSPFLERSSAYPFDRWGFSEYLHGSVPRGWRTADASGTGDLENFLKIFGAILDNAKTDVEHLQTLFDVETLHDDLIYLHDQKIGWPTWFDANGLKRREESLNAVNLYKIRGRALAYENMLKDVSEWDVVIAEGWKYIMWSNGLYGSTTPDTTDPYLKTKIGWLDDVMKYTSSTDQWPGINHLRFFMSEIPGISGELTQEMWVRFEELLEWGKASYVTTSLVVVPLSEEVWVPSRTVDWWYDSLWTFTEPTFPVSTETDLGATTTSADLFETADPGSPPFSVTNSNLWRTYHSALTYA